MSTKTISARITLEEHQKILDICNVNGWTVNEFINNHIESMLRFENDQIKENKKKEKSDTLEIDRSDFDKWMLELEKRDGPN